MTVAVFDISIDAFESVKTTVGSFGAIVLGSSLMSVTSFVLPGLLAVAETVLMILPVFAGP